jgi:hypothetical protein
MSNPRSPVSRDRQLSQAWNDAISSGAKPTDANFMDVLEAGSPGAKARLAEAYQQAYNGQEIARNNMQNFKVDEQSVKNQIDMTSERTTDGRRITLQEAVQLGRERGLPQIEYDGYVYDVPAQSTPRTSSGSSRSGSSSSTSGTPSRYSTPSSSRPSTGQSTSRSGYTSMQRTTPATIQPVGKARSIDSTQKRITLEDIRANGGNVTPKMRVGQRITFQDGGQMRSGVVKYYNPYNGDFDVV